VSIPCTPCRQTCCACGWQLVMVIEQQMVMMIEQLQMFLTRMHAHAHSGPTRTQCLYLSAT
jgi:hypothetical protein